MSDEIAMAKAKVAAAYADLDRARRALEDARFAEGVDRRALAIAAEPSMTVEQLRESIADAARSHGARCAEDGETSTGPDWLTFRALLKALAARAVRP